MEYTHTNTLCFSHSLSHTHPFHLFHFQFLSLTLRFQRWRSRSQIPLPLSSCCLSLSQVDEPRRHCCPRRPWRMGPGPPQGSQAGEGSQWPQHWWRERENQPAKLNDLEWRANDSIYIVEKCPPLQTHTKLIIPQQSGNQADYFFTLL